MIAVFIVEDEPNLLEATKEMVKELGHKVVGSASTMDEAHKGIVATHPELVLLDVELGSATSFELLEQLDQIDFQVIFITAHQKYALDAFRFSAVDFLLKPLSFSALEKAIMKVEHAKEGEQKQQLQTLQYNLNASAGEQKIILKTQEKIEILKLDEIVHCESDMSYTIFHTAKESIMVSRTMGYYEELLEPYGFFRLHRSHLINMQHIRKVHKTDAGEVELTTGARIPLSQRKREAFLKLLDKQGLH